MRDAFVESKKKVQIRFAESGIKLSSDQKASVNVKVCGEKSTTRFMTCIKEIELFVSGLERTNFENIPMSCNGFTFCLPIKNASATPIILKEGQILGNVTEAIYGTCVCLYLNEDRKKLYIKSITSNETFYVRCT